RLEVMRSVISGSRPVSPEFVWNIERKSAVGFICESDRFGVGITGLELKAICESAADARLKSIVIGRAKRSLQQCAGNSSELSIQNAAVIPSTDGSPVEFLAHLLPDAACSYIGSLSRKSGPKFPLNSEVKCFHVTSSKISIESFGADFSRN